MLNTVKDIVDAGAAGVTYGRNVWQDANPVGIVAAIKAIVHDGASPAKAAEIYKNAGAVGM